MNITLRQLRSFACIARESSFTVAAQRLNLTQSATSALLRELERQLGLTLINRTTRSVALTQAGQQFLENAKRILRDVDFAVTDVRDLRDKRRGTIRVAASPLLSVTFLPRILAAFGAAYPGVNIQLHDVLTEQILEQVRSGSVDMGIGTFQKSATELELVAIFEDRLGVVVPRSSQLARRRVARWTDLVGQHLISLTPGSAFRAITDATINHLGLAVSASRFEVGYMGTAVALVEAGLGVSVLPARAASLIRSRAAVFRPLLNPTVSRAATLVTRADRTLSPAAEAFVTFLSDKNLMAVEA